MALSHLPYTVLFWFYNLAFWNKEGLVLNPYVHLHAKYQRIRMFSFPLLSILIVWLIRPFSIGWASFLGGVLYAFYTPAIMVWVKFYKKVATLISKKKTFSSA
ncbi:hypothetical protein C8N25_12920 [Algoriphagus antarcticus]|uniref:Uncharacterized protein n=1 Tax=Algoriphagus antarcticus TaxID=238540 RepID=A0A3E0DG61_9BACT|nr:hypothetical protein C8N25_12920 [Algoriphagus antarcticus]